MLFIFCLTPFLFGPRERSFLIGNYPEGFAMAGRVWLSARPVVIDICKSMQRSFINRGRGKSAGTDTPEVKADCVNCVLVADYIGLEKLCITSGT